MSAFVFLLIHDIFISDIWFSLLMMLVAGTVCGLCVSWSYGLLVAVSSVRSWLLYNLLYVVSFMLLAVVSVVVYEPMYLLAEMFGLIVVLNVVYVLAFMVLERNSLCDSSLLPQTGSKDKGLDRGSTHLETTAEGEL